MFKQFARSLQISLALIIAVFSNGLLSTAAYAAPGHPVGNNGFVKVDGETLPDEQPENEPHLNTCSLFVDFYNYDQGNTYADVSFAMQSPTASDTVTVTSGDTHPFIGGDPASGSNDLDAHQQYGLSFTGAPASQGYHVKVTVAAPGSQGHDTKTKVFWMPASCQTTTTAVAPTATDLCGTVHDTYLITTTPHVQYFIQNGSTLTPVSAGTHSAGGATSITVVAQATDGYVLAGASQWTLAFTDVACVVSITPTQPTPTPPTCQYQYYVFTFTAPAHYHYEYNGQPLVSGTSFDANGATVTITAVADSGYTFGNSPSSWQYVLTPANGCGSQDQPVTPDEPSFTDVCGIANDTYTIPSKTGVDYFVNGTPVAAGTYHVGAGNVSITITAQAQEGYIISEEVQTEWSHTFTNEACPPEKTPAHITYVVVCTDLGVKVTLTNDGQTDGSAIVANKAYPVPAGGSVEVTIPVDLTYQATFTIVINDHTDYISKNCAPGTGGGSTTPSKPPTPAPVMPTEIPSTGGEAVSPLALMVVMLTAYGAVYLLQGKRREYILGRR